MKQHLINAIRDLELDCSDWDDDVLWEIALAVVVAWEKPEWSERLRRLSGGHSPASGHPVSSSLDPLRPR